jgi:hypothetical protein
VYSSANVLGLTKLMIMSWTGLVARAKGKKRRVQPASRKPERKRTLVRHGKRRS